MIAKQTSAEAAAKIEALELDLARHIEAGEIDKPEYETMRYRLDRAIEAVCDVIAAKHLWGKGGELHNLTRFGKWEKKWSALVSAMPVHSARELLFIRKKLEAVKAPELMAHDFYKDVAAFLNRYEDTARKFVELKTKIITTTQRRAQKQDAEEAARIQAFRDARTLVAVLETHLEAYVTKAGEMARLRFEAHMANFAAKGWDIDAIAPKPAKGDDYDTNQAKSEWRYFVQSITAEVAGSKTVRQESIEHKARFVAAAKDAAHADYMAWIYKMIQKIGQHVDAATMVGDPWQCSTITVTTRDGGRQVWHTQMIINYSKYNRAFNQFPSRRQDDAK